MLYQFQDEIDDSLDDDDWEIDDDADLVYEVDAHDVFDIEYDR